MFRFNNFLQLNYVLLLYNLEILNGKRFPFYDTSKVNKAIVLYHYKSAYFKFNTLLAVYYI